MKKGFLVTVTLTFTSLLCAGQTSFQSWPQIGKSFTNFVLDSIENYSKKTLSYNDFKGKWIILDFWGERCSGCIAAFPHINEWQKEFANDVQFVLVTKTYEDPNTAITLFKKLQTKFGLTMPVSFDQIFFNSIGITGMPTWVIINPKGIVENITTSISSKDIMTAILSGKKPSVLRSYLSYEKKPSDNYRSNIPFLLWDNGGDQMNFMYRSVISEWNSSMATNRIIIKRNRLEIFQRSLERLYRMAFFGNESWSISDTFFYDNYYYPIILELSDSSLFNCDYNFGTNLFSYSLSFQKDIIQTEKFNPFSIADKPRFMKIMQKDLENCFGYTGTIEKRMVSCYKLTATEEAKRNLKTKGGPQTFEAMKKSLKGSNLPSSTIAGHIYGSSGYPQQTMPLVDETGMHYNIDVNIDAYYFDDYLREIRKLGLDLVPGKKEMKVLVIRDGERSN